VPLRILPLFLLAGLLPLGCEEKTPPAPDAIRAVGPATRCAALKSTQQVRFTVFAKRSPTLLGGETIPPLKNVRVLFRILPAAETAPVAPPAVNQDLHAPCVATLADDDDITDAGGNVTARLMFGSSPGVCRLLASLPDHPEVKPRTVVFLAGVVWVDGSDRQDGTVSGALDKPVALRIQASPDTWYADAAVEFDMRRAPAGTRLSQTDTRTDSEGIAATDVFLGKKQGAGEIGARILNGPLGPDASRYTLRAQFFAIDPIMLVIEVIGGLAVFIFGMRLMSEGLSLAAGDRLRSLLNFLTNNRFAAVGVGLTVTGLIQSSSACSVMVIGFVNAGLIRLEQAIGVIMGSHIGTTVTAQMVSFKLGILALPAVAVGVVTSLLAKRSHIRFSAQILIGFGLLFLGMGMMSDPLQELGDSETLIRIFRGLDCAPPAGQTVSLTPFLKAVAAGMVLTMIVQSSSASIGLLIALAGAGLLNIYTCFAILLGDNIGTTITAILAAIGSSRTAKRAACAHSLIQVLGTLCMVLFLRVSWPGTAHPVFMELVSRITDGDNFNGENLPRFIANAHTMFNLTVTTALIGFIGAIASVCRFIISGEEPGETAQTRGHLLDPRLLASPSIAIQQAWSQLGYMLKQSRLAHDQSLAAVANLRDIDWHQINESVRTHEKDTDRLQTEITDYLSEISMEILTEHQSLILPRLLHSVNDVERIGDHSVHLLRLARRRRKRSLPFSPEAQAELAQIIGTVRSLFDLCDRSVATTHDGHEEGIKTDAASLTSLLEEARQAAKLIKKQASDFRKSQVGRQETGQDDIRSGVIYFDVLVNLNRVGGHLVNIIEAALPDTVVGARH